MFQPVVDNSDLSIIQNPAWPRVAVACRWKDAHRRRSQWPHAAMVGPLRTVRGIDLLVRNLLANPQIRIVIIDGADLSAGQATTQALLDLWNHGTRPRGMADDITGEHLDLIRQAIVLAQSDTDKQYQVEDLDRPGGVVLLPPPAPVATASAPHGDPGERVVGDTLIDVWPSVLQRIMKYGHSVPSKYGDTMEFLNLVSVYRNPRGILEDVDRADWLGFDRAGMESYAKRVTTPWAPHGAPYSYGTRIGEEGFSGVNGLLVNKPNDRGIGVSPWLPRDAAGGHGRPCLVWVQFRLLAGALHLQFVFRSHDYFAAYPMNVAALASWLVREADTRGLEVGTITCMSVSAHLYDRDWHDAREVIAVHLPKGHQWDPRSTWRVEAVDHREHPGDSPCRVIRATALTPDGSEVVEVFTGRTAEIVQRRIERSGLLTTIGNALWLGRKLAEAEGSL